MSTTAGLRSFDKARAEETAHAGGGSERRHRHDAAYAAIVLDGAYDEVSADGAVRVLNGDIVLHPSFHEHGNTFTNSGAVVLNIVLPAQSAAAFGYRVVRSAAAPELAALARRDTGAAAMGVLEEAARSEETASGDDWLDAAAAQLRADPCLGAGAVAHAAKRTAAHLSRAFTARYGIGPAAFRAEYRFRKAFHAMLGGARPAAAAAAAGYADQAHFTRECRRITGTSPAALLRDIKSVQDAASLQQ